MAEHSIPLDAQTSLYTSDGRYFGVILALIGPVQEPYYVVYTKKTADGNVEQEDKEEKDEAVVGTELYYRVSSTVSILFAPQALCEAGGGTDASYINDEELPEHVRPDFSDDEKEKQWKRRNKAARPGGESVSSEESLEDIEWSHIRLEEEGTAVPGVAVPSWVADSKK
ncbi:hypothetical protein AGDE_00673 [Angomonas deanei]|nr:hypothetical protein AGDE_00673 [Angomonas deanei]|eukprot:EPY43249.1 hypothetical protein AGDE_00673 [Angomonas deanei]